MATWYSDERQIHVWRDRRRHTVIYRWRHAADQQRPSFEAALVIPEPLPADEPVIIADARERAERYDLR